MFFQPILPSQADRIVSRILQGPSVGNILLSGVPNTSVGYVFRDTLETSSNVGFFLTHMMAALGVVQTAMIDQMYFPNPADYYRLIAPSTQRPYRSHHRWPAVVNKQQVLFRMNSPFGEVAAFLSEIFALFPLMTQFRIFATDPVTHSVIFASTPSLIVPRTHRISPDGVLGIYRSLSTIINTNDDSKSGEAIADQVQFELGDYAIMPIISTDRGNTDDAVSVNAYIRDGDGRVARDGNDLDVLVGKGDSIVGRMCRKFGPLVGCKCSRRCEKLSSPTILRYGMTLIEEFFSSPSTAWQSLYTVPRPRIAKGFVVCANSGFVIVDHCLRPFARVSKKAQKFDLQGKCLLHAAALAVGVPATVLVRLANVKSRNIPVKYLRQASMITTATRHSLSAIIGMLLSVSTENEKTHMRNGVIFSVVVAPQPDGTTVPKQIMKLTVDTATNKCGMELADDVSDMPHGCYVLLSVLSKKSENHCFLARYYNSSNDNVSSDCEMDSDSEWAGLQDMPDWDCAEDDDSYHEDIPNDPATACELWEQFGGEDFGDNDFKPQNQSRKAFVQRAIEAKIGAFDMETRADLAFPFVFWKQTQWPQFPVLVTLALENDETPCHVFESEESETFTDTFFGDDAEDAEEVNVSDVMNAAAKDIRKQKKLKTVSLDVRGRWGQQNQHRMGCDEVATSKFLDFILDLDEDHILYAHNGSGFDFLILFATYMARIKALPNDIVLRGNRLLSFTIPNSHGALIFFRCSFVMYPTSLEKLCDQFNTTVRKQVVMTDSRGRKWSSKDLLLAEPLRGPLSFMRWLRVNDLYDLYVDYGKADSIGLLQAMIAAKKSFVRIVDDNLALRYKEKVQSGLHGLGGQLFVTGITASSLSVKFFYEFLKLTNKKAFAIIKLTNQSYETWGAWREAIIGGISICPQPGIYGTKVNKDVTVFDVISLYPYTLSRNVWYPKHNGKRREFNCTMKQLFRPKVHGVGVIRAFITSFGSHFFNRLPILGDSSYDWYASRSTTARFYTTADLNGVFRDGGEIVLEYGYMVAPADLISGRELFAPYLNIFKKIKQEASDNKNSAQYVQAKLCMNGLSGVLMMKNERTVVYNNGRAEDAPMISRGKEVVNETQLSPVRFPAMMLSATRDQMFTYYDAVGRKNIIMSETDSLAVRRRHADVLRPYIGTEFGQLTEDWKNMESAIIVDKKVGHYNGVTSANQRQVKNVWKRVPQKLITPSMYGDFFMGKPVPVNDSMWRRMLFDKYTMYYGAGVAIPAAGTFVVKRRFRYSVCTDHTAVTKISAACSDCVTVLYTSKFQQRLSLVV
jgi:hypothetical protein